MEHPEPTKGVVNIYTIGLGLRYNILRYSEYQFALGLGHLSTARGYPIIARVYNVLGCFRICELIHVSGHCSHFFPYFVSLDSFID